MFNTRSTRFPALIFSALVFAVMAQASSEGPKSPSASANDGWVNSSNMNAQDGVSAQDGGFNTSVDKINFGFSAVSGTVNGVLVEIDEFKTGTRNNTLVVNLLNVGTCSSKTLAMDTTDDSTYDPLGSAADTWSCTALTAANINNTAFGVTINANKSSGANPSSGSYNVDHVRITVTYTPAAARKRVIVSRSFPAGGPEKPESTSPSQLNARVLRFETECGGAYAKR